MKTILLIRTAATTDFGGAEVYQLHLAHDLTKHSLRPIIVTNQPTLLNYAKQQNLPTTHAPFLRKRNWSGISTLLFPLYLLWQLRLFIFYTRLIIKTKPSAVHIQSKDEFIAATYAARLFRKQTIWTDHADLKHIFQNIFKPLKNPVGKLIFGASHKAHAITVASQSEIAEIHKQTDDQLSLTLVHNTIPDRFTELKSIQPKAKNFIIISRINHEKGIGEAITAFTAVHTKHPDTTLDIFGDGDDLKHFQSLTTSIPAITFHGHISDPLTALAKGGIFLAPTYHDAFSLSILEAAMMQKPIIASDIPSVRELLTDHQSALLVSTKDPKNFEKAMLTLLENSSLAKNLAKNARKTYEQKFNFTNTITDRFIKLYTSDRKIKIRVEASCLASPVVSGVGAYTQQLIDALAASPDVDLDISYFNFLGRKPYPTTKPPHTTHAIRLFPLKIYAKLASYRLALPFDLFLPRVDLTIFPNFHRFPTIKSKKTATTIHDLTHIFHPEVVESKNLTHLNRVVPRALIQSDLILTVSETSRYAITKNYHTDPSKILVTHIAPDPMYTHKSTINIHKKYQIPFSNFILFIGNFEPRKNLSVLIKAYQLLPTKFKVQYGLILVGGNSWKNEKTKKLLDRAVESGEKILHIDHVPRQETAAFYRSASLFVMPSIYEGFGMPIVEAAASQIPTLASDIPVLREVGADGCLYADPKKPQDFADQIQKILTNKKLQNQLTKFATKNLTRFSWDNNIKNLLAHLASESQS